MAGRAYGLHECAAKGCSARVRNVRRKTPWTCPRCGKTEHEESCKWILF